MKKQPHTPDVDWVAAEEKLVADATKQFPKIAKALARDEPGTDIYGLCFEGDLVYTAVQAHANTEAKLREYAEQAQRPMPPFRAGPTFPGRTTEEVMEEWRWDAGGWKYVPLYPGPPLKGIAAAFKRLADAVGYNKAEMAMKDDLMTMACRAVIRLERAGVFDVLPRTPRFRVNCIYRERAIESDEESERRLRRVRRLPRS
jgi:hypothetical protein